MRYFLFALTLILFTSCYKGSKVDIIIHNATIHVMNDNSDMAEAMAIKDGKVVEIGPERQIMNKYRADKIINAKKRDVFPGLHDAHGHIFSLAKQRLNADLRNSRSYYELIATLEKHHSRNKQDILIGRGWDHSLWGEEKMPNNAMLNESFPDVPVALTRIDGHAMLVNQAMLDLAGITTETKVDGGDIYMDSTGLSGILLDNAMALVHKVIPEPSEELIIEQFLEVQEDLIATGLTHVHEAGVNEMEREILIKLDKENRLKINIYAMLMPTEDNLNFAKEEGHYKGKRLSIRSFKVFADGALGSHGACMLEPYTDEADNYGLMLKSPEELQDLARTIKDLNYQLNAHCIGDSANRVMLSIVDTLMADRMDHRWRIEHAQIVNKNDFALFSSSGMLPSVQPTHATSDQRWAEHHIGKERLLGGGYAYNSLQKSTGMILFGTDFPIEDYDPFATIYAATQRKNLDGEPSNGFLKEEAVSLDVALKAMTFWASFGCFQENEVGSLEVGKKATFVIVDQAMQQTARFLPNYAWMTVVDGEFVFDMR